MESIMTTDEQLKEFVNRSKNLTYKESKKLFENLEEVKDYRRLMTRIDEMKKAELKLDKPIKKIVMQDGEIYTVGKKLMLVNESDKMAAYELNKPIDEIVRISSSAFDLISSAGRVRVSGIEKIIYK